MENPANYVFLLVSQFSLSGALYTCWSDLVGFVNGLPLVVVELKKLRIVYAAQSSKPCNLHQNLALRQKRPPLPKPSALPRR